MVVTGEIGTGKTTLCRYFLNQLMNNVKTALILNPYFSQMQLLEAILKDFGVNPRGRTKFSMIWELNDFLIKESESGNNVVLIIDEAQNLKPQALEQIRLLSNLETEKDKLLQIILVGQPELNDKLELYNLRQLQQRIVVRYHIKPLDKDEVGSYIEHRLKLCGDQHKVSFNEDAIKHITDFSAGTPRLINILCDRALLAGFASESYMIDEGIIKRCVDELDKYFKAYR
jgi:general secretion pathway protein A